MKNLISAVLYILVVSTYLLINDYETFFMWFAWLTGYFKDLFGNPLRKIK